MELNELQKTAFDRLFNAKNYNHYPNKDGWVTARSIDITTNTLKALVKKGLVEYKHISGNWAKRNNHLYRLK